MINRFVAIETAKFEQFLQDKGFELTQINNEVVFIKRYEKNTNLLIKVYTSISLQDISARACGQDAIRVVVVFDNGEKTFGVGKFARVYRTGSQDKIHDRVATRIKEAIERCDEWCDTQQLKQIEQDKARAKYLAPIQISQYVGVVGEHQAMTLKVVDRYPWNTWLIFTLKDEVGNIFTYFSKLNTLQIGETYDVKFKIVGHKTFKGVKRTTVAEMIGKRIIM